MKLKKIALSIAAASFLVALLIDTFLVLNPTWRADPLFANVLITALGLILAGSALVVFHPRQWPRFVRQPAQSKSRSVKYER